MTVNKLDLPIVYDLQPFESSTLTHIIVSVDVVYCRNWAKSPAHLGTCKLVPDKSDIVTAESLPVFLGYPSENDAATPLLRKLVGSAELEPLEFPADVSEDVQIRPTAYLKAMWAIFWSAILHPLDTTVIDLDSGECLPQT